MIRETVGDLGDTSPGAEVGGSTRPVRPVPPPTDLSAWAESAGHAGQAGHGDRPRLVSQRLGGTNWTPAHPLPTGQAGAQAHLNPVATAPPKRKRRRRRPWYRRPLVVAPLIVLLILFGLGGTALLRLEATMSEVRSVSRPPEVVSLSDEVGQPEVTVDTAPAQAALVESGIIPETDDGGGFFGRFQDGASNISDMAGAAAALAGISESSTGPINVLVMGVDARPGSPIDVGVKADAIMVLNIDPAAGECRMLSIPRDTRTELPGYGKSKINHALLVGGVPYQMLVVEELLELSLDHYLLVDFAAFQQIVDVVGGVTVTVPAEITNDDGATLFAAGPQTMDGAQALAYSRYRHDADGDIGRIRRQWSVLRGLATSASSRDLARDINNLLPAIEDHLRTDLSAEEMTALTQDLDGRCTPDTVDTAVLEGSRQRMDDPILRQSVYFNVVAESEVRAQVETLLGEEESETPSADGRSAGSAGPTLLARRPGPTSVSAR